MNHIKYTVPYLKEELKKYDLPTKGKKQDLYDRLQNYYKNTYQSRIPQIIYTKSDLKFNEKDEIFLGTRYSKIDANGLIRYERNGQNYDMYLDKNMMKMYLINQQKIPTIVIETIINIFSSKEKRTESTPLFQPKNIPSKFTFKPYTQSGFIKSVLYEHQLYGIQWMKKIEKNIDTNLLLYKHKIDNNKYKTFKKFDDSIMFDTVNKKIMMGNISEKTYHYLKTKGGILADEVGLGKTLTILGLIIEHHSNHSIYNKVDPIKHNMYPDSNTNLIICPSYLVQQWSNEIFKHIDPPLKHMIITGKKQHQELTYQDILTSDIVIVSEKFLRSSYYQELSMKFSDLQLKHDDPLQVNAPILHFIEWRRVILDEGHLVLTDIIHKFKSKYRWYVSGTPTYNEHIPTFLEWNVKTKIMPYVKTFTLARTKEDVVLNIPTYTIDVVRINMSFFEKQLYEMSKQTYHDNLLRQICCTSMINTKYKPYSMKDVQTFKDELIRQYNDIIDNVDTMLTNREKELEYFEDRLQDENIPEDHAKLVKDNIDNTTKLRNKLIKEKTNIISVHKYQMNMIDKISNETHECVICYNTLNTNQIIITSCCHIYCDKCIQMIQDKCSICRNSFTTSVIHTGDEYVNKYGSKIAKLIEYIKNNEGKMLIYSQWNKTLNIISKCLKECGINHVLFSNDIVKQNKNMEKFDEDVNIMLMSTQNHSSGLDLYKAKHIIMMDVIYGTSENVQKVEEQIIGRLHRIGQTDEIRVIKMIMNNTIESELYSKMYEKRM